MLDFLNKVLGLGDKVQLIAFAIIQLIVFVVGFILGDFFGNPTIIINTEDGQRKVFESAPNIVGQSFREGDFCPIPEVQNSGGNSSQE